MKFMLTVIAAMLLSNSAVANDDIVVLTENNHIVFSGPVTDQSVAVAQLELAKISRKLDDSDTIYLILDSPGGSISAGNLFIDFANSLPQKIKPICLFCASMAYHMFQSFDERLVWSSSQLMSHRASLGGLGGQVPGEVESRLNSIKTVLDIMDTKIAGRIGISKEKYQQQIFSELWLDGLTAQKQNHADRLAKIKCDKTILGQVMKKEYNTMFGKVSVTVSKCPLINGFLGVEFGQQQFRSEAEAVKEVNKMRRNVVMEF